MIEALETENSAMDRDPFDQQLMDYLFDELDEVTRASVKRRLDTDAAARELEAKLRGALDLAKLTLEEPSDDLEARILEAAARVAQGEPWHRKLLRSLAWAGSHAMRPQFAMAALLVMVLGSSVLLLRAKPGAMRVTAEGVASPQRAPNGSVAADTLPPSPAAAAPPADALSRSAGEDDAAADRSKKNLQDGNSADAKREVAAASAVGGTNAQEAELNEARAVRSASGCKVAISHFQKLRDRYGSTGYGAAATYEEAQCHRELANRARARQLLAKLEDDPEYGKRAAAELARDGGAGTTGRGGLAAPAAKSSPAAGAKSTKPSGPADTSAY